MKLVYKRKPVLSRIIEYLIITFYYLLIGKQFFFLFFFLKFRSTFFFFFRLCMTRHRTYRCNMIKLNFLYIFFILWSLINTGCSSKTKLLRCVRFESVCVTEGGIFSPSFNVNEFANIGSD